MRKEPYSIGSYVHVIKRGTRGLPIVKDEGDRQRFVLMLRHLNDQFYPNNWFEDLREANLMRSFTRPTHWPPQNRLVEIICFCLVDNHFHLLLKEIIESGISAFMKRLGIAMTKYFNEKYKEKGSLFQSSFRSRTVDEDEYFQYVSAYIQVKNSLDLLPGGLKSATKNFNQAFKWAENYSYGSLGEFMGVRKRMITNPELLAEIFTPKEYKEFCRDFIGGKFGDQFDLLSPFER